jgi:hypothetical protein
MAIQTQGEIIYKKLREGPTKYIEEIHCPMLLDIMCDPNKGTKTAFCAAAYISAAQFTRWVNMYEFFRDIYGVARMIAQENWEEEGRDLRFHQSLPGAQDHRFDLWRAQGWARHGIGKNSTIRLEVEAESTPIDHYKQIMKQAAEGAFTAGELKQLIEAVNVGLRAHETFTMQKEIDQLKSDHEVMKKNTHAKNSLPDPDAA